MLLNEFILIYIGLLMYYCDICGNPIRGEPIVVEIEGATLVLCEQCSRKYVVSRKKTLSEIKQTQSRTLSTKPQIASTNANIRVSEGSRTTTFRIVSRTQMSKINVRPEKFEIVENFPEIIRRARENLGLTRENLAKLIGVKESIVRRIEEGQLMPDIELARKLEKVLRVKLLTPSEEMPSISLPKASEKSELTLGDIIEIRKRNNED